MKTYECDVIHHIVLHADNEDDVIKIIKNDFIKDENYKYKNLYEIITKNKEEH